MTRIPTAALVLGMAGLIPFLGLAGIRVLADDVVLRIAAVPQLVTYAGIILSFMAGCIWAFAAQGGRATWGLLILAVTPALWAFFLGIAQNFLGIALGAHILGLLALGFAALLPLDRYCQRCGLAPAWWMPLRIGLTVVVILSLLVAAYA